MQTKIERRDFLKTASVLAGAGVLAGTPLASLLAATKPQKFLVGYAPATRGTVESFWQVCDALSALGFRYIEVDNTGLQLDEAYANRTSEFREEMAKRNLTLVGFAQGSSFSDPDKRDEIIALHMRIGGFLEAVGGHYIASLSQVRGRVPGADRQEARVLPKEEDYRRFARLANHVGRRLREETGIKFGYHAYSPVGLSRLMDLTNPDYFYLVPDLGHLAQGGADALEVCKAYRSRITTFHFKDFDPNLEWEWRGRRGKGRTVVLGRGTVDFPAVVDFLKETEFTGWVMGELGAGPETFPDQKAYMVDQLGLRL